jgi:hypothetical protein
MFELERLKREIDALDEQMREREQELAVERERELAANVRSRVGGYGFASATAAEDFQQLMVCKLLANGLPEHASLDGFLRQELAARPPLLGSYRPQGPPAVSSSLAENHGQMPTVESRPNILNPEDIKPGISKEQFDATCREIGRCLREHEESIR